MPGPFSGPVPLDNIQGARDFAEVLFAEDTQAFIGDFGVDTYGRPLFFIY